VNQMAASQNISGNYIHVLVMGLRSAGLVRTVRGLKGGYELAKAPASITALDVISALEGNSAPTACVTDVSSCPRAVNCAARDVWCDIASAVEGVLSGITLEQLSERQYAKQEKPPDYCI
jgi:Rrf2 family transcriptional regulator, cysteine metabolism repressor